MNMPSTIWRRQIANCTRLLVVAATAVLVSHCGPQESKVSATANLIKVEPVPAATNAIKTPPTPNVIPSLFGDARVQFQSNSILTLTLDRELAGDLALSRIYNVTTGFDLVDPVSFNDQSGTTLPLGQDNNISKFVYGTNKLRLELKNADDEVVDYGERDIIISDFSVSGPSLSSASFSGHSAGHVDMLSGAVQQATGGVLSSGHAPVILIIGLVPMVFQ